MPQIPGDDGDNIQQRSTWLLRRRIAVISGSDARPTFLLRAFDKKQTKNRGGHGPSRPPKGSATVWVAAKVSNSRDEVVLTESLPNCLSKVPVSDHFIPTVVGCLEWLRWIW
ncbi:unnamed protein product [Lactuca saligna]|uniref:Uncharacterized protein n=1 Tax=Lactuca saligna TaxID=75948 RepID=A0AA35ZTI3_LACSI|nr:unnamed protein product [Lactuca saligna]